MHLKTAIVFSNTTNDLIYPAKHIIRKRVCHFFDVAKEVLDQVGFTYQKLKREISINQLKYSLVSLGCHFSLFALISNYNIFFNSLIL